MAWKGAKTRVGITSVFRRYCIGEKGGLAC